MKFSTKNIIETLSDLLICRTDSATVCSIPEYSSVTNDSRKVDEQCVFVAIKGALSDGHNYISEALAQGAKCIIYQQDITHDNDADAVFLQVADSYSAYALLAELNCDFPSRDLKLIGITGTNGKTTTAFLIRSILEQAGHKCGLISTVEYAYPGKSIQAERTTPDPMELQRLFCEMRNSECEYAVMEVSSHALAQNRTGSAKFASAVFSNLSGDHLDYHNNMDSYFEAKKKLFTEHLHNNASAVVNIDDPYGKKLAEDIPLVFAFGRSCDADMEILKIETSFSGTNVQVMINKHTFSVFSPLYGAFNAYNIAAAAGVALSLGISEKNICTGIENMKNVPGRLEAFNLPSGALAFVDYAHTDDALENVLATLRKINNKGSLTVVFGCGGDRDRSKRPRMGAIAVELADKVIITNDNPRSENPDGIIKDICDGISSEELYDVFPDRAIAIQHALHDAKSGDFVLVAGKGHETYQEIQGIKHFFDDRVIIKEFCSKHKCL